MKGYVDFTISRRVWLFSDIRLFCISVLVNVHCAVVAWCLYKSVCALTAFFEVVMQFFKLKK